VTIAGPECVDVVVSTTTKTTTMYLPPHCINDVTDEDESDGDCGGSCFVCADCESGNCNRVDLFGGCEP